MSDSTIYASYLSEDLGENKGSIDNGVKPKQDPANVHLAKHIPVLDVCYLLLSKRGGLTPSDVSRILGLSKQTAGGYLKGLEEYSLIKVEKEDSDKREKRYAVVDRSQLTALMKQAIESTEFKSAKFKGRIYPLSVLSEKLYYQMRILLANKHARVELIKDIVAPTYLYVPLKVINDRSNKLMSIVLYKVDSPEDVALTLGKLILLAESPEYKTGPILAIVIIDPTVRVEDSDIMREAAQKHGKIKISEEIAATDYLITDDFAKNLAYKHIKLVLASVS